MRRLVLVVLFACGSPPPVAPSAGAEKTPASERVDDAMHVLHDLAESAAGLFPVAVARATKCVAIVPGLVHAGLLLGARAGRGVVTCREADSWSDPRFFTLSGAT